VAGASAVPAEVATETKLLHAVPAINLTQYLGKWYQMYGNILEYASFENHSFCDTAQYSLNANGTIGVRNWERQYSTTGSQKTIGGWATCPEGKPPACTVRLQGVPVPAPYYVVALGPVQNERYQWAVVSDPFGASLFVLARDPQGFRLEYKEAADAFLKSNGFHTQIETVHKPNCNYVWEE
jgi:lipocalin